MTLLVQKNMVVPLWEAQSEFKMSPVVSWKRHSAFGLDSAQEAIVYS